MTSAGAKFAALSLVNSRVPWSIQVLDLRAQLPLLSPCLAITITDVSSFKIEVSTTINSTTINRNKNRKCLGGLQVYK